MLAVGDTLSLAIEKPAAGGRMIARNEGQVILVGGAIPGERVTAQIERAGKGVAFAQTIAVDVPSPDRRDPFTDPLCGGCLYAHVAYARQLSLKAEVIADAFSRIAHIPLDAPVRVSPSAEEGYRMRARLHVKKGRLGFFRENTYDLCNARATRQLLPATCDALDRLSEGLSSIEGDRVRDVELSENIDSSGRSVHLHGEPPADRSILQVLAGIDGLTGISIGRPPASFVIVTGDPHVSDTLAVGGCAVTLRRHVLAFFQGNRHLITELVDHVIGHVPAQSDVLDLYAGVGLFSVPVASARRSRVTAVEGDPRAFADLAANAVAARATVEPIHQAVETFVSRRRSRRPDVLIVDPPRTGMSPDALKGALALTPRKVVYVSCDIATLARDAARLRAAGYGVRHLDAFDMFPNTPHVETVAVFER